MADITQIEKQLAEKHKSITSTLERGDRVELVPTKDGFRVLRVVRKEVK